MKLKIVYIFSIVNMVVAICGAQTYMLHGTIADSATGRPIIGASIFLSNTSIGTSANNNGEFTLNRVPKGQFNLVVSSIGYETFTQSITVQNVQQPITIVLSPKANQLMAVVVGTYEKDGWQKWGNIFTENFIGTNGLAMSCTIKNYRTIKFRYSKKRDVLVAFADEPLEIENKALGYAVSYKLEKFLLDRGNQTVFYEGYPFFKQMDGEADKQKRWKEKRADVYYGSLLHFMRSLYQNKLSEDGYDIRKLDVIPNTEKKRIQRLYKTVTADEDLEVTLPKDTLKYFKAVLAQPDETEILHQDKLTADSIAYEENSTTKILNFESYLIISYSFKKEPFEYLQQIHQEDKIRTNITSRLNLWHKMPVHVMYNGMYYAVEDMVDQGFWAWSEKIANMLPFDYWP